MSVGTKQMARNVMLGIYSLIILGTLFYLAYLGESFYKLSIEERYFHPQYELLKPSGLIGHGLGITGSALIVIGVAIYIIRKRVQAFSRWGRLKNWLEFHIFLCTWGTVMVLFHTSFKFGGIISVGFWTLVLVWLSGFIGRYIYIQIPRTIGDRVMTLNELLEIRNENNKILSEKYHIDISDIINRNLSKIRLKLLAENFSKKEIQKAIRLVLNKKILERRIRRLEQMLKLFHYWHIAHIPFTVMMFLILIIHVCVVVFFGYKWIL